MALPDFLKNKQNSKDKKGKAKKDFRQKCIDLLDQIRELNEERYNELSKIFQQKYDKINISKKIVAGFYAQLVNEYNGLRVAAGKTIKKTTKRVASHHRVKEVTEKLKTRAQQASDATDTIKKKSTKVVEEVTKKLAPSKDEKKSTKKAAKKTAKKAAKKITKKTAKKAAKKTTSAGDKKAEKKATKKVTKKAAPKTAKKTAKKTATKTTKKATKKTAKKVTKKKSK